MSRELEILIWVTFLMMLHPLPYVAGYLRYWGPRIAVGNRIDTPSLPAWVVRAQNAHRNMLENYIHFAPLVLMVHYLGLNNDKTLLGASLFLIARLLYLPIYIGGVIWVRTLCFMIGLIGEFIILSVLLQNLAL